MHRRATIALVVLGVPAMMAFGAGTAQATTVAANALEVDISDSTGVADDIAIVLQDAAGAHQVVVTDTSGRPLTPNSGCVQGSSSNEVICTHPNAAGTFDQIDAFLGDGDDRFTAAGVTGFGIQVDGGNGNDELKGADTDASTAAAGSDQFDTLNGDNGDDTLTSRAGDDTLSGGADTDLLIPSKNGAQRLAGGAGDLDRASYANYSIDATLVVGGGPVSGAAAPDDTGTVRAKDQIDGDIEVLRGGGGLDTLTGDGDAEVFDGGGARDTIDGNGGTDTATYEERQNPVTARLGGTGGVGGAEDTIGEVENLRGGLAGDQLIGDELPNLLDGGPGNGNDTLTGADGADILLGGFGADNHNGGGGEDEATYTDRSDSVSVTVGAAGASGNEDDGLAGSRDTIQSNVERTVGSSDDDVLVGDGAVNQLDGRGGADQLQGLGANDILLGGAGPDDISGGSGGRDVVTYGALGSSPVRTRQMSVTIGSAGASGGREDGPVGARDTVGNDIEDIIAGAGADTLVGSAVSNILDGGQGADNMQGLGGADSVTYANRVLGVTVTVGAAGASGSSFDGVSTRDTVATDIETVVGSPLNDTLTGAVGTQTLQGGLGTDTLAGRDDPDTFLGGDGFDTVTYASAVGVVTAAMGVPGGSGDSLDGAPGARDTISGDVERLIGSNAGDFLTGSGNPDEIEGGNGNDEITGGGGNDVLEGFANEDTINGSSGDDNLNGGIDPDVLEGGSGADRMDGSTSVPAPGFFPGDVVLYGARTEDLTVVIGGGPVSGSASVDESAGIRDEVIGIETVLGGSGNDTMSKTEATLIHFVGGAGDDNLTGNAGLDLLEGGAGEDDLDGAANNDVLDGGTERDTLVGGAANDTLRGGDADDVLSGGDGLDDLEGQAGPDVLEGGAQDDNLDGAAGGDQLVGGFGADLIDGGTGVDQASYADRSLGTGTDAVTATIGAPGGSGNADDGLSGARDTIATDVENLLGGLGGDTLTGNGAANEINGAAGPDSIRGGHGIDILRGGPASDTLFSRDSSADQLFCNEGATDRAEVNATDVVAPDCEDVVVG